MTKAELISHIIDHITDPWTECPEDYQYADLIDLDTAADVLKQCREDEEEFDVEDRMSDEVTPELMMEAYNCNVRYQKHELRVRRLADWLTHNECVCEYNQYMHDYLDDPLVVVPVDFLLEDGFPFPVNEGDESSPLFLIELGMRSPEFNPNLEYCWYDRERNALFSSDIPFHDGVIDAEQFARFIIGDADPLGYFLDNLMSEEDIKYIFGCTKEELIHEN